MTEGGDELLRVDETSVLNSTGPTHRRHSKLQNAESNSEPKPIPFIPRIRWPDLIAQLFIHIGGLYGLYLMIVSAKIYTTLFGKLIFASFRLITVKCKSLHHISDIPQ